MTTIQTALSPNGLLGAAPAIPALGSIRRHGFAAFLLGVGLVGGLGGWAYTTSIAGAVIASGQLVVESEVKKLQHPTGGVVGQLLVQNGDHVHAGDVLIRLDETQVRANLDVVRKALDELSARQSRNEAERDGAKAIAFDPSLAARRSDDPVVGRLVEGEIRLFAARVSGQEGQRAQLSERVKQLGDEVRGLSEQAAAKAREITLIAGELKGVRELYNKALVPLSRLNALERDATRLEGERGQLLAASASAKGKIAETQLQILQIDAEMRTETGKELAEVRGKWSELVERRVAAEDQLKRVEMRAPQDGIVHQMSVHTVGGLVSPNEPALLIVPEADRLMVEVRVAPQDIDSVRLGQKAVLRFAAFNARTTPEVDGTVSRISADVTSDPKTGTSFYTARVSLSPDELARFGGQRLMPGMPVEAHLQIGERSALSWLVKPLMDQAAKAWKEK
jgi:HlyD family secretion protein